MYCRTNVMNKTWQCEFCRSCASADRRCCFVDTHRPSRASNLNGCGQSIWASPYDNGIEFVLHYGLDRFVGASLRVGVPLLKSRKRSSSNAAPHGGTPLQQDATAVRHHHCIISVLI